MLERLRCGIITTGAFRAHLALWHEETEGGNFGLIPQLDYVRFATGARAGEAYASLLWQPINQMKPHEIFDIGGIKVYFSKATRTALKEHCLDAKNGAILVK
jgi:hypothetical protein